MKRISFVRFAAETMRRPLTRGQSAFARVAFDREDPGAIDGPERAIAIEMFGGIEEVPPEARRVVVAVLGRDSGKTTLGATFGVYTMLTARVAGVGPGEIPTVVVIAPDVKTAHLTVRMALGMVRATPSTSKLVVSESRSGFVMQRPDGALVAFEAFAASRGGASVRGRPILAAILDESGFFYSGDTYVRTDGEIFSAITPRLMKGGIVLLISTPWGEESLLHKLFADNFGAPKTALVAKASTLVMRDNDPEVAANVAAEMARDEDNARREFFCEFLGSGSSRFFDPAAYDAAVDPEHILPAPPTVGAFRAAGMDLGLTKDAATCTVAERRDARVAIVSMTELRPKRGAPLKLSEVIETFAGALKPYGVRDLMADGWAREPAREWTTLHKLTITAAPEGQAGKQLVYMHAKQLANEGRLILPQSARLAAQWKAVVSKPTAGGGLQIISPRRAGTHGDQLSSALLAIFAASTGAPARILPPSRPRESYRFGSERGFG